MEKPHSPSQRKMPYQSQIKCPRHSHPGGDSPGGTRRGGTRRGDSPGGTRRGGLAGGDSPGGTRPGVHCGRLHRFCSDLCLPSSVIENMFCYNQLVISYMHFIFYHE